MRERPARENERRGVERGFTLIELVVVVALLSIVMSVVANTLWEAQRSEAYSRGRTAVLDEMRVALNRMSKDLRQTSAVIGTPTPSRIEVRTYVAGVQETVIYQATSASLTRTLKGGAVEIVYSDLVTADVFSYEPDTLAPEVVKIVLVVTPSNLPDTTLTLDSEVRLRNRQG